MLRLGPSGRLDAVTDNEFRVFAPRRARLVALSLAVGIMVLMVVLSFVVREAEWLDRFATIGLGALIAGFLYRQATVRAVPSPTGLYVRNLFLNRQLEWAEIVAVRLGDDPWVRLDLSDGDTLSVMGIQRSDGVENSQAEASRLAGLVEKYSYPAQPGQ